MVIPRISTRGFYDLSTGKTIKSKKYLLYPKSYFEKISDSKEITIMIHGLRNNKADALNKFLIAKRRLRQLRYTYPVIGFTYDSNTKGAHLKKSELHALRVGQSIAKKNGKNLGLFILDFKKKSPKTKIRLIGHSLGTEVILNTLEYLSKYKNGKQSIESVYFFGSSIESNTLKLKKTQWILKSTVHGKIINYHSKHDEVLNYANKGNAVRAPLGLAGYSGKIPNFIQKHVVPENHRFASYAKTITKFP